jgi:aldose 1-epimerase
MGYNRAMRHPITWVKLGLVSWIFSLSCNQVPNSDQQQAKPSQAEGKFAVSRQLFGKIDSNLVFAYTLTNPRGMAARVSNYGGTILGIVVPDRNGVMGDVVLGFDSLSGYLQPDNPYLGALIGRYANRVAHAAFTLEGKRYTLGANDHGNSLHGGWRGFDKKIWKATVLDSEKDASLKLTYDSPDGEEGYPGNLHVEVVYSLSENNALKISYLATTDRPTPINLTNHSYFNLSAGHAANCLDHQLTLYAHQFTPVNDQLIPDGRQLAVLGTPMDFTMAKSMGQDIARVAGGYDHNFVLNTVAADIPLAARVYDPVSGRIMEMYTTEPGVQFYTGNFLTGKLKGKAGLPLEQHGGFCLEAQHFPDSPNQPSFPSTILYPGKSYRQVTIYKFMVP